MTVAFFVASLAASAQVQSAVNLHPANPFPFQTDALKQAWINANPKDYVRMGGDKPIVPTTATGAITTPEFTTQADKDAWIAQQEANAILAKEAAINAANAANPPTVITQVEKEAWLAAHASAPAASTIPLFATEADKDAWLLQQELNAKNAALAAQGIIVTP